MKSQDTKRGALLRSQQFAPGEYRYLYPPEPPVVAVDYGSFFAKISALEHPTAGDVLVRLNSLLAEHSLSSAQTRALLEYLATLPDIKVDGRVDDRLGRTGISFSTDSRSPGEYVDRLVVSDIGLGILSTEVVYIGHGRTDIQAPTVVKYTAWE